MPIKRCKIEDKRKRWQIDAAESHGSIRNSENSCVNILVMEAMEGIPQLKIQIKMMDT